MVWFNKGDEPRCAGCDEHNESEFADSDDGHECDGCNVVPPPPADLAGPNVRFLMTKGGGMFWTQAPIPALPLTVSAPPPCPRLGKVIVHIEGDGKRATYEYQDHNGKPMGVEFERDKCEHAGSSCTDGCPILAAGAADASTSPAAPCSCEETEDAPQAPAAEPPALLTLSQHKDPAAGLPAAPHWQEGLLKAFRGRRLSELFEPQAGQTPAGHELGRLLAEFPKHPTTVSGQISQHGLTIVDMPDRVRIFECNAATAESEKVSETVKVPAANTCPNCREEFRAFLEEMFRSSDASESISQTSHHEGDHKASEAVRDLPNVTHSKIATVAMSYPLRDLVLCDDAGRPVFDTCSIIDHLQSTVAPESWSHPSVSIQLDQQSVSLVVTQTAEVHQKIADHLRYLRRLQIKQICNLIERLSGDADDTAESGAQTEASLPASEVELGPALPVGRK
jgi:hypothetical protein